MIHLLTKYFLLLIGCAWIASDPIIAQTVPSGMTYQGRLTDASNAPVPDGTGYEIEVRLWSAPAGGTLLWGTRYSGVPLKGGAFNIILGSGGIPIAGASTADLKAAFNAPTVHLGLTTTKSAAGAAIPSPAEILPRQQIFSSPYAFRAETAAAVQTNGVLSAAIKDGEVKSADIGSSEVQTGNIANLAVTTDKIAPGAINSSSVSAGAISSSQLAPNAVQSTNIAPGAVAGVNIANGAVGKDQVSGIVGAASARAFNTVYRASTDGFVVGNTPERVVEFTVFADDNNPPMTVLQSVLEYPKVTSMNSAITFPVRKGSFYRVTAGGSGGVLWFFPLGN